jgi:hypothetical protein
MEEASTEALSERIFTEMVGAMSLLAEYLGHRLALFKMKNLVKSSYPLRQALMLSLFGILTSIMIYVSASEASEYEDKTKVQSEIEGLHASGRLAEIIQSMRLDEL